MCRGEDLLEVSRSILINPELLSGRLDDPPQPGGVLAGPLHLQVAAGEAEPLHHAGRQPGSPGAQHSEGPTGGFA